MLAGIRLAAHRFSDRQEEPRLLVDMDDEAGIFQVLWSGQAVRQRRALLSTREPVLIHGHVRTDRQGCLIVMGREVERIEGARAVLADG